MQVGKLELVHMKVWFGVRRDDGEERKREDRECILSQPYYTSILHKKNRNRQFDGPGILGGKKCW